MANYLIFSLEFEWTINPNIIRDISLSQLPLSQTYFYLVHPIIVHVGWTENNIVCLQKPANTGRYFDVVSTLFENDIKTTLCAQKNMLKQDVIWTSIQEYFILFTILQA